MKLFEILQNLPSSSLIDFSHQEIIYDGEESYCKNVEEDCIQNVNLEIFLKNELYKKLREIEFNTNKRISIILYPDFKDKIHVYITYQNEK